MGAIADSSPVALWEADAITGLASGDSVGLWPDGSGNGHDASNAPASGLAWVDGETPTGLPVVRWTIAPRYLDVSTLSAGAATMTLAAVVKVASTSTNRTILGSSATGGMQWRIDNSTNVPRISKQTSAGIAAASTGLTVDVWAVIMVEFVGGSSYAFYKDGAVDGSGSTTVTLTTTPKVMIGAAAGTNGFVGDLAAIVRWDRALTSTEKSDVYDELNAKWIAGSAPSPTVDWLWAGAVTDGGFTVKGKATHAGVDVRVGVEAGSTVTSPSTYGATATTDGSGYFTATITGLSANTAYAYAVEVDGTLDLATTGQATTLPTAGAPTSFAWAHSGCALTDSNHRVFDAIATRDPLLFQYNGDLHYEDIATNSEGTFLTAYDDVNAQARRSAFHQAIPMDYVWDDHDWAGNNTDRTATAAPAAQSAYRKAVPHYPLDDAAGIFHWYQVGRVAFVVTDLRSYRDPNTDTDSASKTMLGATQKAWFKQTLVDAVEAGAQLIVWVSSSVWNSDSGDLDSWGLYSYERAELADYIKAHDLQDRLLVVSGDAHMLAYDDGTNSDFATGGGAPLTVLAASALDQTGNTKGTWSGGTSLGGGRYGVIEFTDSGTGVAWAWSGYSVDATTGAETLVMSTSGSVDDFAVTGSVAATAPAASASAAGDVTLTGATGAIAATAPAAAATAAGLVTTLGQIAATAPAATVTAEGDVTSSSPAGSIAATAPAAVASLAGEVDAEPVALAMAEVVVDAFAVVELSPAADIDVAVPILSEKHPAPVMSAAQPMHQAWVDYTPTTDIVGYAHLWVDGVDVTYFRDKPILIRNWTAEAPWGDKTALWEMPQLDEWDVPGEGDLSWLRPDAPVVIGIVDLDGNVHRKWSGFYHSRTTGFDSGRDFVFEAHGGMWAAMWQTYEPPPYQKPIDIGRLVPRLLNRVIGRRWNPIPETTTGILTRYRGSRDQKVWQAVQDILAEAWTEDGRQWTLVQVSDDEYRLRLKADPATTVDGSFAYGNPAIDVDVTVDEDSRVDIVKARGIGERGGAWANVKYPGVEILNGLPYPNSDAGDFINPGETDASTDSGTGVTDWQTKVRDLGYTTLAVSGVMSSAWVDVVYRVQRDLSLGGVDGQIGPETWTATFNEINEDIDLTPIRLPMAKKPQAWPWKHAANGAILGPNPNYDPQMIPREVALDLGPGVTKAEGFKIARTYLAVNGDPVVTGRMSFRGCLDDLARTDLTVGSNVSMAGYLGETVAVQLGRVSVDLDVDSGGVYVVNADVDERARDALTIDQILARNRDALPDPARRPGNPNRSSRQVRDEGFSWDAESPCGVLTRTAVNGDAGYWSRKTIPFAEVGQLAGIRLHSTVPFAFAIFGTLRMTPRKMRQLMPGGPFASTDPWRDILPTLEGEYGLLGAWGAQDDACGYGGGMESDGYSFTGEFVESNTLEYVTETPPYVDVFLFARGTSGFVWGDFLPARQT